MICRDCQKDLKGGFGIGSEPYKEFQCFSCVEKEIIRNNLSEIQKEADYYLQKLQDLWNICMPSKQGHFKRGLGSIVLNHLADACSYRQRQYVLEEQNK